MEGIVFLFGLIAIVVYMFRSWGRVTIPQLVARGLGSFVILIVLANLAGAVLIVPAGHRVVVFDKFTGVKPNALGEGMHLIIPFLQDAVRFDVRVQKTDVKANAASKDLQDVSTELVLNFRPNPEKISTIYQHFGTEYADKVVTPAVQEVVKAVLATYTAEEIITKREQVKSEVHKQLKEMITRADLELEETYITNFAFSEAFAHAIEQKQVAEQLALKANRDLDRIKIEANQKIAQARAEAEGLRMQKDAITSQLIELRKVEASIKAIEKWNGVMPHTILGDKAVPFISLNEK